MYFLIAGVENYWLVRAYFFGLEVDGNVVSLFGNPVFAHILFLFKAFSLLHFLIRLSLSKEKISLLFAMSLLNMVLYCLLTSGRDIIFYFIIYAIFYFRFGRVLYFKTSVLFFSCLLFI